ncbi:MAG: hypothetical protein NVS3B12_06810 [Acidimicrobiales bacterium]
MAIDERLEGPIFLGRRVASGWTVVAVHESKQSWEKFRDDILMPRMQAEIEGGFPSPPQETEIDVSTVLP